MAERAASERDRRPAEQERVVAAAAYQRADKDAITLLQVVPVRVHGSNGSRDTFALLDPGAQTSLCGNELADHLGIPGESQELCVQTVEGSGRTQRARKMEMELSGLSTAATKKRITVPELCAVPRLNISLPRVSRQHKAKWQHLEDLDIPDCASGGVELLLGANVIEAVIQHEARTGQPGQPVAARTDRSSSWTRLGIFPSNHASPAQDHRGGASVRTGERMVVHRSFWDEVRQTCIAVQRR